MNLTETAAIIGALAWLPPIIGLIRRYLSRPQIEIFIPSRLEIGHTVLGPIINMRIAFTARRKEAIIDSITATITHEDGQRIEFTWQGIVKRMFQMNAPDVGPIHYENEQHVLVIKVGLNDVDEKFIRFQIAEYSSRKRSCEAKMIRRDALARSRNESSESLIATDEFHEMTRNAVDSFVWKKGRYSIEIKIIATDSIDQIGAKSTFVLNEQDVDRLKRNLDEIPLEYENQVRFGEENYTPHPVRWEWVFPELTELT